ncbi:MAG TPA: hypothetical protein VHP99_06960, partial [Pyrinomonadaceae bacterium]|nr:hypothetical protein [Pyrinomonadaceae bacterium]
MFRFCKTNAKIIAAGFTLIQFLSCHSPNKPMTNITDNSPVATDPLSIHRRAIIVDMHADTTQRLVDENVDLQ